MRYRPYLIVAAGCTALWAVQVALSMRFYLVDPSGQVVWSRCDHLRIFERVGETQLCYVGVLAACAVSWKAEEIERRARVTTACRYCGYDLCATPSRCPECGSVPTPLAETRS